ncbi:hypothetical protein [Candidatus Protochlamydia phocaeensis]|uniref:hypothetical protein n=1 Tax=Candidatus Protochlamydia phocaeensis TaxID=1414722 RepID=UPI000A7E841A|nr:hypothetical protein [Candidatus Protochlamydia phocaeensis]
MKNQLFSFQVNRWVVILFWIGVLAIFLVIYFFYPSLFNQMRQVSYQDTPYVDTPRNPP